MTSYVSASQAYERERTPTKDTYSNTSSSGWSGRYRGATVEDLDPPPALSTSPHDLISSALLSAYERDYTHLTVISSDSRSLLGYLSIPRLKSLLKSGVVSESDPVEKAMLKFRRKGHVYQVITMDTPLEELEKFFDGRLHPAKPGKEAQRQDFAVVTDATRKFVLGVATREDLEQFVKRRPT
ncbi:Cystathionine beta-synthase [Trichophyton interdigitale]|nr:Cystathionine beta-synthase [Trichophyton interdigitale]KAG5217197.1 Cystathionine beta-synthase [Trichophyton interdigitale]KAG8205771.1 Cystathionine beta-synthase [Trichophyton interdigitale]